MDELDQQTQRVVDRLLERQIRDYLSLNLGLISPGLELVGVEHAVPFGRIDILARDRSYNHTVIELKRGIATRDAIGQLQSYMGAMQEVLPGSDVAGILVAKGLDPAAKAALSICRGITFVKYEMAFTFEVPKLLPPTSSKNDWLFPTGPVEKQSDVSSSLLDASAAWPMPPGNKP
ncbi:MAG: DUF91 domain-containing protein [Comamonadaceae bacterium]|nr:MAG: DUF91 domain-containing protein [Comamonadaceae bacterium]